MDCCAKNGKNEKVDEVHKRITARCFIETTSTMSTGHSYKCVENEMVRGLQKNLFPCFTLSLFFGKTRDKRALNCLCIQ